MAAAAGPMEVAGTIDLLGTGPPKPIWGITHTSKGVCSLSLVIPMGLCFLTAMGNHPMFCTKNVNGSRSVVTEYNWGAVVGLATDAAGDIGVMIKDDDGKKTVYYPGHFQGAVLKKSDWLVTIRRDKL